MSHSVRAEPFGSSEDRIVRIENVIEPLTLSSIFPAHQPVEVELGSGDGSFLAEYAAANPGANFVGVERLLGRLRKIARKAFRTQLQNVVAIRIESTYFVQYLLPPQSIRALHIYFPDPWPKRKHRKNRIINETFPAAAMRVLQPGGCVFLRTDDADYYSQMREVFSKAPAFQEVETPPGLAGITTDFEREFNSRGIPTRQAAYAL